MKRSFIKIEDFSLVNNQLLSFELSYSNNLRKYFHSNELTFDYHERINRLPDSILYVSAISNLICTSWAVGADLYVDELDQKYFESLQKIKAVFKKWYPKLPFTTEVQVNNLVENHFPVEGTSLLFSGGLDSITSYFRHKDEKPQLIMLWFDYFPPFTEELKAKTRKDYQNFAEQEGVVLKEITANTRKFINSRLLRREKGRYITDFSYWAGFEMIIAFTGSCAPITANQSRTIYVASSLTKELVNPWGSHPEIDNKIAFADTKVQHDAYELSRQEKLHYLKPHLTRDCVAVPLSVCSRPKNEVNCCSCEKCFRTIMGLMTENIDPRCRGFDLPDDLLNYLKNKIPNVSMGGDEVFMWADIQKHIPDPLPDDYKYKDCLEWFKTVDVSRKERSRNKIILKDCLVQIYYKILLPHKDRLDQILGYP